MNFKVFTFLLLLGGLLMATPIVTAADLNNSHVIDYTNALSTTSTNLYNLTLTPVQTIFIDKIRFQTNTAGTSALLLKVDGETKHTIPSQLWNTNTIYDIQGFNISVNPGQIFLLERSGGSVTLRSRVGAYNANPWVNRTGTCYTGCSGTGLFTYGTATANGYLRVTNFSSLQGIYGLYDDEITSDLLENFSYSIMNSTGQTIVSSDVIGSTFYYNLTGNGHPSGTYYVLTNKTSYRSTNDSVSFTGTGNFLEIVTHPTPAINLSFYDEITKELVNNVTYRLFINGFAKEYNTSTGFSGNIELNDTGVLEIEYEAEDYSLRKYYLTLVDNTDLHSDLYLINDTESAAIDYLITNEAGVELTNATLSVLRRYVEDNLESFEVVSMSLSNSQGEGQLFLQQNEGNYKFIINYEGNIVLITNPTTIFNNNIVLRGSVGEDVTTTLYSIYGITYTAEFNNPTFDITWQDSTNRVNQVCLDVYRLRAGTRLLINDTCVNAATGSISLGIDNSTTGDYFAIATASTNINDTSLILVTINQKLDDISQSIGIQGIFFTAILVIVAALVAIRLSPIVAILLSVAALIFAGIIGILSIGVGTIFLISAVGGVLLYAFRRGGG